MHFLKLGSSTSTTDIRHIRLWAQNINVILLCNPVTTQWCITRGQMAHNVSKCTILLWQDCTVLSTLRFCAQSLLYTWSEIQEGVTTAWQLMKSINKVLQGTIHIHKLLQVCLH